MITYNETIFLWKENLNKEYLFLKKGKPKSIHYRRDFK